MQFKDGVIAEDDAIADEESKKFLTTFVDNFAKLVAAS